MKPGPVAGNRTDPTHPQIDAPPKPETSPVVQLPPYRPDGRGPEVKVQYFLFRMVGLWGPSGHPNSDTP